MSFEAFIVLLTIVTILVRWVLFELYDRKDDGPGFVWFMLDPDSQPSDRFRLPLLIFILGAGVAGMLYLD